MFENSDATHMNGPDLPKPRRSHCSIRVDPGNDYWILGGRIGDYENANYSGVITGGINHQMRQDLSNQQI